MADITTTTTSDGGFDSTSRIGDFEIAIDPRKGTGPSPNESLVATYASCFLPALRVGAQQRGVDDLGRIDITAAADLDEDDDLAAIRFTVDIEATLDDEAVAEIVERAEGICHVHAAVREELQADVTVNTGAF